MNKLKYILPVALAAMTLSCAHDVIDVQPPAVEIENTTQEVLIKFSPDIIDAVEEGLEIRGNSRSGLYSVDDVLAIIDGYELERVFPVDKSKEGRSREAGLHLWYVVRFKGNYSVDDVIKRLSKLGEVQIATPNRKIQRAYNPDKKVIPLPTSAISKASASRATTPYNDPLQNYQWSIVNRGDLFSDTGKGIAGADVGAEKAWEMSTGDPSIIVAVLDEGVCLDHPELAPNMWHNEGEVYRSHDDNDGNGYAGDYYGYNFAADKGIISWDNLGDSGHATHVAGVIAAQNNNGEGIMSIAGGTPDRPGVKIMTCQIFSDGYAAGTTVVMARAIKYAADNGAVVLQCSFGYVSGTANVYDWGEQGFSSEEEWATLCPLEKEAFDYFCYNAGSPNGPIDGGIAIFASGNESAPSAGFPGAAENYVSVAATAADYTPAVYSNYGEGTTISAPGGDQDYYYEYGGPGTEMEYGELGCILSTMPYHLCPSGYGYMEGTSMACPHVSGVVALGLSYAMQLRKHFTADEFKELLYSSAVPFDEYLSGNKTYYKYVADVGQNQKMQMTLGNYRNKMGAGQVNAERLLKAIEGNGIPIRFPNIYVPLNGMVALIPGNYFLNGETLTYTVQIEDPEIASCTLNEGKMIFNGLGQGATKASITASNGVTQDFIITVRNGANSNGWL